MLPSSPPWVLRCLKEAKASVRKTFPPHFGLPGQLFLNFFFANLTFLSFFLPGQLAALSALVIAEPALVRLLPSVAASVHCQVGAVLEHLQGGNLQRLSKFQLLLSCTAAKSILPTQARET